MQIHCPSCDALILSEDMNLANMVAACRKCNALIDLRDHTPAGSRSAAAPIQRLRVPMPRGIRVDDSGDNLRIAWRWFSPQYLFLALFCVAWDSFLVFWYSMTIVNGAPWIMIVFPIVHVAVGIGLTYFTLAGFLNQTIVSVDRHEVIVRHGPLPWYGNCRIMTDQIEQLYVEEQTNIRRGWSNSTFDVSIAGKDGKKIPLLTGLAGRDRALFFEQQIEEYLGIDNQPVPGEIRR